MNRLFCFLGSWEVIERPNSINGDDSVYAYQTYQTSKVSPKTIVINGYKWSEMGSTYNTWPQNNWVTRVLFNPTYRSYNPTYNWVFGAHPEPKVQASTMVHAGTQTENSIYEAKLLRLTHWTYKRNSAEKPWHTLAVAVPYTFHLQSYQAPKGARSSLTPVCCLACCEWLKQFEAGEVRRYFWTKRRWLIGGPFKTVSEWGSNKAMVEGKDIHAPSNRGPFDIAEHVVFLADGNADATSQVPEKNATNFPSGGYRNRVRLVLWQ